MVLAQLRTILSEQFEYTFFGFNFLHPKGGYFYGNSKEAEIRIMELPCVLTL